MPQTSNGPTLVPPEDAPSGVLALPEPGALGEYVRSDPRSVDVAEVGRQELERSTVRELSVRVLVWRGVDWTHDVTLIVPRQTTQPGSALVFAVGGGPRDGDIDLLRRLAEDTGVTAAVLRRQPNQPLGGEFGTREEDELVAYTFVRFLDEGGDWPLLLPMAKATSRVIDAVQQSWNAADGAVPERFAVGGTSKRAWSSWLAAAADDRIDGVVSVAFDFANIPAQFRAGASSSVPAGTQIGEYAGVIRRIGEPRAGELLTIVDPVSYGRVRNLPTLVIRGTDDRNWAIDASSRYWDVLSGPRTFVPVVGGGHDILYDRIVQDALGGWLEVRGTGMELPTLRIQDQTAKGVTIECDRPTLLSNLRLRGFDTTDNEWHTVLLGAPGDRATVHAALPSAGGWSAVFAAGDVSLPSGRLMTIGSPIQQVPRMAA